LDWTAALVALDQQALSLDIVTETVGVILKYQDDIQSLSGGSMQAVLDRARLPAEAAREISPHPPRTGAGYQPSPVPRPCSWPSLSPLGLKHTDRLTRSTVTRSGSGWLTINRIARAIIWRRWCGVIWRG